MVKYSWHYKDFSLYLFLYLLPLSIVRIGQFCPTFSKLAILNKLIRPRVYIKTDSQSIWEQQCLIRSQSQVLSRGIPSNNKLWIKHFFNYSKKRDGTTFQIHIISRNISLWNSTGYWTEMGTNSGSLHKLLGQKNC